MTIKCRTNQALDNKRSKGQGKTPRRRIVLYVHREADSLSCGPLWAIIENATQ